MVHLPWRAPEQFKGTPEMRLYPALPTGRIDPALTQRGGNQLPTARKQQGLVSLACQTPPRLQLGLGSGHRSVITLAFFRDGLAHSAAGKTQGVADRCIGVRSRRSEQRAALRFAVRLDQREEIAFALQCRHDSNPNCRRTRAAGSMGEPRPSVAGTMSTKGAFPAIARSNRAAGSRKAVSRLTSTIVARSRACSNAASSSPAVGMVVATPASRKPLAITASPMNAIVSLIARRSAESVQDED
jgi:hypothetical protein